jgi:hypothetical protein
MSTISKCIEIEDKRFQGLGVGGSEKWELIAKGYRGFLVGVIKMELDPGDQGTTCELLIFFFF